MKKLPIAQIIITLILSNTALAYIPAQNDVYTNRANFEFLSRMAIVQNITINVRPSDDLYYRNLTHHVNSPSRINTGFIADSIARAISEEIKEKEVDHLKFNFTNEIKPDFRNFDFSDSIFVDIILDANPKDESDPTALNLAISSNLKYRSLSWNDGDFYFSQLALDPVALTVSRKTEDVSQFKRAAESLVGFLHSSSHDGRKYYNDGVKE